MNAESQFLVQRWSLGDPEKGGYVGDNFQEGEGRVMLAYGKHSDHPLCLEATSVDHIEIRRCSSTSTTWLFESDNGAHAWSKCNPSAAEEGMCSCVGEMRFGDGEANLFTTPVMV